MTEIDTRAHEFLDRHVAEVAPLLKASHLAGWEAAVTGSEEALQASADARATVKRVYARSEGRAEVRRLLDSGEVTDPLVRRQLVVLDHAYTANQITPETINELARREAELEGLFYNFRAKVEGVEASDNQLRDLLTGTLDSGRRRRIWEASKTIGPLVAPRLRELVERRNTAARSIGFRDFYAMELALQEIDEVELFELLEDFARRSDDAFREVRDGIDAEQAARYGVPVDALRPWHWEDFFAQEAPHSDTLDLDPLFEHLDLEAVARDYFDSIGLPIDDVLARSDLYEREGKDQHAFCTAIDREGDVRMLCNLRPNERWMKTLLHEIGHAAYDKYLPSTLPFLLRTPAHTLSTESIAMYFGRLTRDPEWLEERLGVELGAERVAAVHAQQRASMLIAARWMLVMIHFERALYADPNRTDLNSLWWDLVEEFQRIRRPEGRDEPDWATKIHLSTASVYYHNYLLGELMASQLTASIRDEEVEGAGIGTFLRERIFARGASLTWNDLLREATGEPLSARYFVEQFVGMDLAPSA